MNSQHDSGVKRPVTSVDCHAHVMSMDRPLSPERHSAPKRNVTVEEYLDVLDRHGISHGLLTQPSFYGSDNTLLLEGLATGDGRLRGTAIVDPQISAESLHDLKAAGICGVRLNWLRRPQLPDACSAAYQDLFLKLREAGLHVDLYVA